MEKFGKSQPVKRFEDQRFLTGAGKYVDNIIEDGALVAYFLRSNVAHGLITTLELDDARGMPGVALVIAAADLEFAGVKMGLVGSTVKNRDGTRSVAPIRPIFGSDPRPLRWRGCGDDCC